MLIASNKPVCQQCDLYLEVKSRETISSLAMNAFIYSVKSCSEVSSTDCLVASENNFCPLFGSSLETPQKEQKLGEKTCKKSSFQVRAEPVKRTETR